MKKILIIFSSVHGQTRKITNQLAQQLKELGNSVVIADIKAVPAMESFDKIVIGASIRHGKHNPALYEFIQKHQKILTQKVSGFFSVSLVARKPEKNTPETNPYMQAFLSKTTWRPTLLQVFGGNLNYQGYNAFDRNIIRFIMWLTKGPTDPVTNVEYTDWQKVNDFGLLIHQA
ncbi:menaquinone-dependent protoporphyrinogen IX dehydrogenase [Shewanella bicestrii]|uniref:Protoporphyrinogen IX dehydrogenase [quinone] n=1 Tax=Shewanella seohaensis TaxID=755175 RepID=A0ABV4VQX6_9GAMM|nr:MULTISPECIES: menaquinone-dependent protoporphyrinogen IX dehydrogenase [Shewanella]QXN24220.1 menaquinone-dependent protoporphyrinogen IX dehydrogenase [Shewanella putrefaciens]MCL1119133.1 menaquinone-dependent protoporphyrinogen IX dehydrogenase [Shewanella seohaensis]MDH1469222.1 menaquinone-dependent protoporphyrinogen IX dehydrogenase [Shewanella sp. GD03713]UXM81748.1 menaquinone-dependent protoporphyrinogen IX dehydrogenase [Shewanella seohaensis]VEE62926.1 Protoporphyrinogen IX deh